MRERRLPTDNDIFVVSECFPKQDVSHCALEILPGERAKAAFRAQCAVAAHHGVKLSFRKMLRRRDLLAWAVANDAKLSLGPPRKD